MSKKKMSLNLNTFYTCFNCYLCYSDIFCLEKLPKIVFICIWKQAKPQILINCFSLDVNHIKKKFYVSPRERQQAISCLNCAGLIKSPFPWMWENKTETTNWIIIQRFMNDNPIRRRRQRQRASIVHRNTVTISVYIFFFFMHIFVHKYG